MIIKMNMRPEHLCRSFPPPYIYVLRTGSRSIAGCPRHLLTAYLFRATPPLNDPSSKPRGSTRVVMKKMGKPITNSWIFTTTVVMAGKTNHWVKCSLSHLHRQLEDLAGRTMEWPNRETRRQLPVQPMCGRQCSDTHTNPTSDMSNVEGD
jgi:hypothetical protein